MIFFMKQNIHIFYILLFWSEFEEKIKRDIRCEVPEHIIFQTKIGRDDVRNSLWGKRQIKVNFLGDGNIRGRRQDHRLRCEGESMKKIQAVYQDKKSVVNEVVNSVW